MLASLNRSAAMPCAEAGEICTVKAVLAGGGMDTGAFLWRNDVTIAAS
jgi:hypothetical protein